MVVPAARAVAACYTNVMTTISAEAQLEALHQRLLADNPCPELAASATQLVFGAGSSTADIMLIGEAPGVVSRSWGRVESF